MGDGVHKGRQLQRGTRVGGKGGDDNRGEGGMGGGVERAVVGFGMHVACGHVPSHGLLIHGAAHNICSACLKFKIKMGGISPTKKFMFFPCI